MHFLASLTVHRRLGGREAESEICFVDLAGRGKPKPGGGGEDPVVRAYHRVIDAVDQASSLPQ